MRYFIPVLVAIWAIPAAAASEDVTFSDYQVYEFDPARFAPNDSKPTLYKIDLVGKGPALWIEGADYNYQWLTIVPYEGIQRVKLDRRRGNPFIEDTSSWIGKQLAKAGDIRGWFTITFLDRKNQEREVVLLAPVNGDAALADFLATRSKATLTAPEPEPQETPEPVDVQLPASAGPVESEPAAAIPERNPAPPPLREVKLIDVMTVSEFRAAGLMKLTDAELRELDAWINRFLAR